MSFGLSLLVCWALLSSLSVISAQSWHYCTPMHSCWPTVQDIGDLNKTLDGEVITAESPLYRYIQIYKQV